MCIKSESYVRSLGNWEVYCEETVALFSSFSGTGQLSKQELCYNISGIKTFYSLQFHDKVVK